MFRVLPLAAAIFAHAAGAATYYVSPQGGDGNSGLNVHVPFKTIGHAASLTRPGDTVRILPGTYQAPLAAGRGPENVLTIERSGAPGAYITYTAYSAKRPVLFNETAWSAIDIAGASYIVIRGLEIRGNSPAISREQAIAGTLHDAPTNGNCIVVRPSETGAIPHHILIEDNVVHDCPGGGIATVKADYISIERNVVYRNAFWSKYGNSGISIYESRMIDTAPGYHNVVCGNRSYDNEERLPTPNPPEITDGNGIIIDDLDNSQSNKVPYTARTLVCNNISWHNGGRGIHVFHSQYVDVVNNTTYENNRILPAPQGELSAYVADHDLFFNNIAYARKGFSPVYTYGNGSHVTFEDNLYFNGPVSTGGAGNLSSDPLFMDPQSGDFQLQPRSPAVDSGVQSVGSTQAPAVDITGASRPRGKGIDRGAYEQ